MIRTVMTAPGLPSKEVELSEDEVQEKLSRDTENRTSWIDLRAKRNVLLSATDWTQLADSPLTSEQKTAFATYRQDLRDLPDDYPDASNVVWPTAPEA